jgi:BASS family bile acid:Na+ symporter
MIDRVINILVTVTLIEMMVAIGLGVRFVDLAGVARTWRLVGRAILANYFCVPAVTAALLFLFDARSMVAVGFLIVAVCPGAPFGPPCAKIAKGDVAAAAGLMVILAGSSAIAAPLLLQILLLLMSGDKAPPVDAIKIVATLLGTQLFPLLVGLSIRHWQPVLTERLQKPANLLSAMLSLLTVGVIFFVHLQLLMEIHLRGYLGMSALLIASWAAGWVLGGPSTELRKSMTLTTSLRNVGVGLVIATGSFAGTEAVTVAVAYGILEIVGSFLLALWWARRSRVMEQTFEAPADGASLEASAQIEEISFDA